MEILFLIYFFVLVMGFSVFLYFKFSSDLWFQLLCVLTFLVHLVFLFFAIHDMNNLQMGSPIDFERVYLDNVDPSSSNTSLELIQASDKYHVFNFANLNELYDGKVVDIDFCFRYNNSDGSNLIYVTNGISKLSDGVYVRNNTIGSICDNVVNVSLVNSHSNIGYHCADCSVLNKFGVVEDLSSSASFIEEVEIDNTNVLNYVVDYGKPHIIWLEVRYLPVKSVNDLFFVYLWVVGSLFLVWVCWLIIKIFVVGTDEALK